MNEINFNNINERKYFENFGYNYFGPITLGFSKWLYDNCKKNNIKKIFFLSRDGFILKKAFDSLKYKDKDISTIYLYASRRAIIVPSLCKLNSIDEIFNSITFGKELKMKYFLKKVGLEDYNLEKLIKKYNVNIEKTVEIGKFKKKNIQFLKEIFPIIIKNSKNELENMNNYFKKNKVYGKFAIVDIGWYGTMQSAIQRIINNSEIFGFYLGVYPYKDYSNYKSINGFIFDHKHNQYLYEKFRNFTQIFEFMTLARHGSLKKYDLNSLDFYSYEYSKKKEEVYAELIQNSAIDFVIKNQNLNYKNNLDYVKSFIKKCLNPKMIDAKTLGSIEFMDDETKKIVTYRGIKYYLLHPKKIVADINNSIWKIGFLKLLFKIDLPYNLIVNYLRKIKERKEK